jgi:hypothetical protein
LLNKNEDFFFNRQRSGLEELQSYQPSFYRRIREMVAINTFAGLTLDNMAQDMDNSFIYHFLDSGPVETLEEFERFLAIDVDPDSSIENRKSAVKLKWRGGGKMSRSRIKSLVYEYCNSDCTVSLTDSQLIISMKFTDDPSIYMPSIRKVISSSNIPAHIEVVYSGELDCVYKMIWRIGTAVESMDFKMWFSMYPGVDKLDGSALLDGSRLLDATYKWFEPETDVKIDANTTKGLMKAECSLVTRTNYYQLDGSLVLDGSVTLNASEVKEDL